MSQTGPENTSSRDPFVHLLGAMSDGPSGYIEGMERQGQQELLQSTTLPTDTGGQDDELIALGFTFGEKVPGDDLFRQATLPGGWTREGSDHAMHSYILDQRGVKRASMFYKAAFYDRRADMHIINVGGHIASEFIYGDEPKPVIPADLTADELADVTHGARSYLVRAAEHPDIYGDRVPRAEALLAAAKGGA
jgi:hypothetical protein